MTTSSIILKLNRNSSASFTMISNKLVYETKDLSAKAFGILVKMLGRPDNWKFYKTEMKSLFVDGLTSISSGLKELEAKGYLSKKYYRTVNGAFDTAWIVVEHPSLLKRDSVFETPRLISHRGKAVPTNKDIQILKNKTETIKTNCKEAISCKGLNSQIALLTTKEKNSSLIAKYYSCVNDYKARDYPISKIYKLAYQHFSEADAKLIQEILISNPTIEERLPSFCVKAGAVVIQAGSEELKNISSKNISTQKEIVNSTLFDDYRKKLNALYHSKMLGSKILTKPISLLEQELKFHLENFKPKASVSNKLNYSFNVAIKLLKNNRWDTPYKLRYNAGFG